MGLMKRKEKEKGKGVVRVSRGFGGSQLFPCGLRVERSR